MGDFANRRGSIITKPTVVWKITTRGMDDGQIHTPIDCAFLPKGVLAVSEYDNQRIQLFDTDGSSLSTVAEGAIQPRGIAVDQVENTIITVCNKDKTIKIYNTDGKKVDSWDKHIFGDPHGIAMTVSDKFVVTDLDPSKPKVSIHDLDGSIIRQFGSRKEGDAYIENPNYVAVDKQGRIIIADYTNHCIKVYNMEGGKILKFGSYGDGQGQLNYPNGIYVDHQNNIFVADNGNHRVSLFSQSGKFIQDVLRSDDSITWPEALAVSESGLLAVTESGIENDFLKVFKL